jgi:hypothetical protein
MVKIHLVLLDLPLPPFLPPMPSPLPFTPNLIRLYLRMIPLCPFLFFPR